MGLAASDQQTLMMRRRAALGGGLVLLVLIILLVGGCLKSRKQQALETYNQRVGQIVGESDQQVSHPFFAALSGASASSPLNVELNIDQLRALAQTQAASAKALSVPGSMDAPQRDLLLALDLRAEGLTKIAALVRTALGGQNSSSASEIAGDMEMFLASDVIYSQRVAPLIEQALKSGGITSQTVASTQFVPNLGWLDPSIVQERITGQASSSSQGAVAPGHHGHVLKGVSVGTTALEAEPAINRVKTSSNPTFTVQIENDGEFTETDVKVDVTVTVADKPYKASHVVNTTEPGKTINVEIPVPGVPLGSPAKIEAQVEPVPGETNHEGTKGVYLAILGE
jgi:hypothetical protein